MPRVLNMEQTEELFSHLDDPDENHEEYLRISNLPKLPIDLGELIGFKSNRIGLELIVVSRDETKPIVCEIYYLDHIKQTVLFSNIIEEIELPIDHIGHSGKPVAQFSIWRDLLTNAGEDTRGLVQSVFFRYLLPRYNAVISDGEQTRDGSSMWKRLISMAMDTNVFNVHTVDTKTLEFNRLSTVRDLVSATKWLWGHDPIFETRKITISTVG